MRYVVTSTLLYSRLQSIEKVILPKNAIAILSCFLFDIKGNTMTITATDKDTTLKTSLELQESNGDCRFAIESKQIMNILKELPEQPLTLDINSSSLQIDLTYQNGHFTFQGQPGEDYPEPVPFEGEAATICLDTAQLVKGISTAIVAAATEEARRIMTGLYFDITPEDLSIVASDGHKLIRYRIYCDTNNMTASFTLPPKPANIMKNILEKAGSTVTINIYEGRNAVITTELYTISCRLIEDKYPNYRSVIPTMNNNVAIIDRASFVSTMRRILVVADKATSLVKFTFDFNKVHITAENLNYSLSAEEELVCQYEGMNIKIGFKGTDLLDLINNLDGREFTLKLSDASRAGLILPDEQQANTDLLMLLMPLLINN